MKNMNVMTFRTLALVVALVTAWPLALSAVGTVAVVRGTVGSLTTYTLTWTSDASGAVSGNAMTLRYSGELVQIRFVPGTAGAQPSDLYDATLVDSDGADVLAGSGANLSNSAGTVFQWDPRFIHERARTLDLVIANAGNANSGTVILYVDEY